MIERISHYRIVTRIGRGAMGEVYHAIDERLGRGVALKLLPASISDSADSQSRLLREAQAASALNHPGIVTVHDIGAWEGRVFMVMELVEGSRFSDAAREGITLVDALALVAEAADALGAAHARSIFHRDIKSDNLMRTRDGRAKVLDFGLAKLRDVVQTGEQPAVRSGNLPRLETSEALAETIAPVARTISGEQADEAGSLSSSLESSERGGSYPSAGSTSPAETVAGSILGTPAYMSPEQAGGAPVDVVSEVFSLGVVLYELVTGTRPFTGGSIEATLDAIQHAPLVAPSQRAPLRKIPAFVDGVVLRALERTRSRRYPDMAAFASAMRAARQRLHGRARRRVVLAGALGTICVLAAGGVLAWRHSAPEPTPKVKTVRRITFESGCEELPSFLPDGKTVLYDARIDGDYEIFSLDLRTGTRTRLTATAGWDYGATLSPDGKTLAWLHKEGKDVQLAIGDMKQSAPRFLGPATARPAWAARDSLVTSPSGMRVESIDPATNARRLVATLPGPGTVSAFAAFDDGKLLALVRESETEVGIGSIDAAGRFQLVVDHLSSEGRGLAIAPGQDAFYYTRPNGNIYELVRHALVDDHESVATGGSSPISIALARDRKHLVYSTCAPSRHIVSLEPDGRTLDFTGAGLTRDEHPHVVDNHRIVFVSNRGGPTQVWLYDASTHEYRPLTGDDTFAPSASHDGQLVAYRDHANGGLFVVGLDKGVPLQLTHDPSDDDPSFSSDDSTIVFHRGLGGVFAVPVSGGEARAIVTADATSPVASPRTDDVLYLTHGESGTRIMRATLDGRTPRAVDVELPAGDYGALRISPDGARVAMLRNAQELVEVGLAPGSKWKSRWTTLVDRARSISYDAQGKGFLIALMRWEGDLWLAEGEFP